MNWVMRSARRPPWASPRHDVLWNGIVNSKRDTASDVNPALLHKKMLQLLSSLWVTRAVGTFARLGLADVMEDGVEDYAAIAAARGLAPDRAYRLLRAPPTPGLVAERTRGAFVLTPHARLLDMAEAIAAAKRGEGGPLPGASFVTGDVFTTAAPEGGDVYLLRHLLHDYDDRDCVRILANVRRAMHPQARVLVLEAPLPSDDSPGPGRWLDLQVMLLCGWRQRPVDAYAGLVAHPGLRPPRTISTGHP